MKGMIDRHMVLGGQTPDVRVRHVSQTLCARARPVRLCLQTRV